MPSARLAALTAATALSGCAWGFGTMDVGSGRHTKGTYSTAEVDHVQNVAGYEVTHYDVTQHETDLSGSEGFVGAMLGFHGGRYWASLGDEDGSGWLAETLLEILVGAGRFAGGIRLAGSLRTSDEVDVDGDGRKDEDTGHMGFPVTLHGYLGLSPAVSTHIGAGVDTATLGEDPFYRFMGGLRVALSSGSGGATMLVLDVDHLRGDQNGHEYRSFGLLGGFVFLN